MTAEKVLLPDDAAWDIGRHGWVSRRAIPDPDEAIALIVRETGTDAQLHAEPVLMREESEVEARINGHDFPFWVECTKRARASEPYWRIWSEA